MQRMQMNVNHYYVLFIVLIILVALIGTVSTWSGASKTIIYTSPDNDNIISVKGSAEKKVMPDEAYINFAIETTADKAADAQKENAQIWDALKASLDSENYLKYETQGYSVSPYKKWNKETQEYETKGYKVRHSILLTLSDITKAGEIADLLVEKGVNTIDSIYFGLKKETQREIKDELWAVAFENAKKEAKSIADAAGAKLTKLPKNIQMNFFDYYPVYYNKVQEYASIMDSAVAETSIAPQELTVSVSLNVVFGYE